MNSALKLGLYLAFTIGAILFASLFYKTYQRLDAPAPGTQEAGSSSGTNAATGQQRSASGATNASPAMQAAISAAELTNAVATNLTEVFTNAASATNAVASTNQASAANTPPPTSEPAVDRALGSGTGRGKNFAPLVSYTGGFFLMVIGLAFLAAGDVSQYMSNRAIKVLYNDEGDGLKAPEYEQAEQVWADGNHLEAIRMLREYLNANPREVHVALRIAEIYEKDLQNFLAAALEYEEILKNKLEPERWGWAAIHLCNLYFKLGHNSKAVVLLRRIDAEYGKTQAAEKARKRLLQMEEEGLLPPETEPDNASTPNRPNIAAPDNTNTKLPPGFGPRK